MLKIPNKRSFISYSLISAILTIVFVSVYGFTNAHALQAEHVYQLYFPWELSIPLVPESILIYFSLNLLTITPLFTLNEDQIIKLGLAMMVSTLVAGVVFYLFPAPIGFIRNTEVRSFKPLFEMLYQYDKVANTFPSLHITYSFITIRQVSYHQPKIFRFMMTWFVLIALSVVFTHQHHIIDVIGGMILAEICFRLFCVRLRKAQV